jgi:hypothetical protein
MFKKLLTAYRFFERPSGFSEGLEWDDVFSTPDYTIFSKGNLLSNPQPIPVLLRLGVKESVARRA